MIGGLPTEVPFHFRQVGNQPVRWPSKAVEDRYPITTASRCLRTPNGQSVTERSGTSTSPGAFSPLFGRFFGSASVLFFRQNLGVLNRFRRKREMCHHARFLLGPDSETTGALAAGISAWQGEFLLSFGSGNQNRDPITSPAGCNTRAGAYKLAVCLGVRTVSYGGMVGWSSAAPRMALVACCWRGCVEERLPGG